MKKAAEVLTGLPIVIGLMMIASAVYAQDPALIPPDGELGGSDCSFYTGVFGFHCFPIYVAYLIQTLFGLTGGFFLTNIIFAGFQIAYSPVTGDKDKGKERLRTAILGFAICVLAFLIVDFIASTLLSPI